MLRRAVLAIVVAAGLAATGCGGGEKGDAYGELNARRLTGDYVTIEMKDLQFHPQGIMVKPGTTVTWVNGDPVVHNVRQVQGAFLSPDEMPYDTSFSFRFEELGTFRYQCTYHHPTMNGVVIVVEE